MLLYNLLFSLLGFRMSVTEGGGGAADRGDDFTPPPDDDDEKKDEKVDDEKKDEKVDDDKKDEKVDDEKKDEKVDDDKKDDKKKEKWVPESRHTEAIRKHKDRNDALQARIKELEGQSSTTKVSADIGEAETKIDELQDQYEDALHDNNKAKAKEIRGKIRAHERTLIDLKAEEKARAAKEEALDELRYEAAIVKVEADYPAINPDSDDYDEDKATEVLQLRNAMIKSGLSSAKALQKAAKYVLGEPGAAKSKEAADTRKERDTSSRKKAADANDKQPPSTEKVGLDSDKAGGVNKAKDVTRMSQDQFAKLDDETLSRLRGDTV